MLELIKNKSFMTNLVTLLVIALGWGIANQHVTTIGYYALSGAITNWLAIYMLFEKIPFLYGSGVVPNRFQEFKQGIKNLIMLQFFTEENIQRFFKESTDLQVDHINIQPVIDLVDFERVFQGLVDAIMQSSFGGMLSMLGGAESLQPLKDPLIKKLKEALLGISQDQQFAKALASQTSFFHPEKVVEKVEQIVEQRLNELTPKMVKMIVQNMIRKHLGWLVVWGGVFGGLIGLVVSFVG